MKTALIHITPECEKHIAYCARVSSSDPNNPNYAKLLAYCIKNKHWSVFEMGSMCIEITTSRAIAQQILRHRSFHFQEFSQRYAKIQEFETYLPRRQDPINRQNSIDDMNQKTRDWFLKTQDILIMQCKAFYADALSLGIAKEQARFLLPLGVQTKMFMHGTIRDWIHYIELRIGNGTQKEHIDIAKEIQQIFIKELPIIAVALGWK